MNLNHVQSIKEAIRSYFEAIGINCEPELDGEIVYWSYIIDQVPMTGWISIFPESDNMIFSASMTFGCLKEPYEGSVLLDLLEKNSHLLSGLSFGTLLGKLVAVGFNYHISQVAPRSLHGQLFNLYKTAHWAQKKLIFPESGIESIEQIIGRIDTKVVSDD